MLSEKSLKRLTNTTSIRLNFLCVYTPIKKCVKFEVCIGRSVLVIKIFACGNDDRKVIPLCDFLSTVMKEVSVFKNLFIKSNFYEKESNFLQPAIKSI